LSQQHQGKQGCGEHRRGCAITLLLMYCYNTVVRRVGLQWCGVSGGEEGGCGGGVAAGASTGKCMAPRQRQMQDGGVGGRTAGLVQRLRFSAGVRRAALRCAGHSSCVFELGACIVPAPSYATESSRKKNPSSARKAVQSRSTKQVSKCQARMIGNVKATVEGSGCGRECTTVTAGTACPSTPRRTL